MIFNGLDVSASSSDELLPALVRDIQGELTNRPAQTIETFPSRLGLTSEQYLYVSLSPCYARI